MKLFSPRLLAVAVLNLCLAGAAQAAPHGILWARGKKPPRPQGSGNLLYYGGPVISHAKVYAVFWGDGVAAETKSKIGPFFANILDSTYMDWLSEYDTSLAAVDGRPGTKQHIGRGSFAGAVAIKPANSAKDLTDAMVQAELEAQIAAGKLPPSDGDSLYMVYFPSGIGISIDNMRSCQTFCAYHEGFTAKGGSPIFYGVMPACGGWGCGSGDAFNSLGVTSSHEALEAITDPFPTPGDKPAYPQAWNTSSGDEVADLCQGTSGTVTGRGLVSSVQGEWDNKTSACLTGPWAQAAPLVGKAPGTHRLELRFNPAWVAPKGW